MKKQPPKIEQFQTYISEDGKVGFIVYKVIGKIIKVQRQNGRFELMTEAQVKKFKLQRT